MIFLGIDVHKNRFTVAQMNENLENIKVEDMELEGLLGYINDENPKIIAVDAPNGLNKGLMNNEEYRSRLNVSKNKHYNKKVSEYELSRRNIQPFSTPADIKEVIGWKEWMKTGFQLFDSIREMGYTEINDKLDNASEKGFVEVFPHACFTAILGYIPSKKNTEEGLNERIEVLEELGVKPIKHITTGSKHLKSDKLDAIVAAYTALCTYNDNVTLIGDRDEGLIAIPVENLKDTYTYKRKKNNFIINSPKNTVVEKDLMNYEYEYINVDSIVWLKYFTEINGSPQIYDLLDLNKNSNTKVMVSISTVDSEKEVVVMFEPIKNSAHGLKACKDFKSQLKSFWGSHGDRKKYLLQIIKIIR